MTVQVMVDLSADVYRRAESLALVTRRKVPEVLADTIEISLPAISGRPRLNRSIADLTDQRVWALMQVYQEQLLQKAQALTEAVRRGLREPLSS